MRWAIRWAVLSTRWGRIEPLVFLKTNGRPFEQTKITFGLDSWWLQQDEQISTFQGAYLFSGFMIYSGYTGLTHVHVFLASLLGRSLKYFAYSCTLDLFICSLQLKIWIWSMLKTKKQEWPAFAFLLKCNRVSFSLSLRGWTSRHRQWPAGFKTSVTMTELSVTLFPFISFTLHTVHPQTPSTPEVKPNIHYFNSIQNHWRAISKMTK